MRALLILAEGFEEIEAVTLIDVLRRAGIAVTTASLAGKRVRGSHDITLESDALLSQLAMADFDALVLPGGPAARTLREAPQVLGLIREAARLGKLLGAICAAPTALEAAGVLAGKRATAYPGSALPSAHRVDERVVEDGNIVTSCGPATTMEFALTLVERLAGPGVARETAERLLFDGWPGKLS